MGPARLAFAFLVALLAGPAPSAAQPLANPVAQAATDASCPEGVAEGSCCLTGRDSLGAYHWLAMPPAWNRTLAVHAHGGPELGEPKQRCVSDDLTRWSMWTRVGYVYAGTGYHEAGVAVHSAASDRKRVRQLFVHHARRQRPHRNRRTRVRVSGDHAPRR